jgi:hypothetical protein
MTNRRPLAPFALLRHEDATGVSGTGLVASGRELWPGGWAILSWKGRWHTLVLHTQGIASVVAIHGHDGRTEVVWL